MAETNKNILSKDSRKIMLPHFERSLCGCSTRKGTLVIGWFHFIICFIPFVILIGYASFSIIEIQDYLEVAQNLASSEISTQLPNAEESTTFDYNSEGGDQTTTNSKGPYEKIIYSDGYKEIVDLHYPESYTLGDSRIRRDVITETLDDDLAEIEGDFAAISKEIDEIDREGKLLDLGLESAPEEDNDNESSSKKFEKYFESSTNKAMIDTLTEKSTDNFESSLEKNENGDGRLMNEIMELLNQSSYDYDDDARLLRLIADLNRLDNERYSNKFGNSFETSTNKDLNNVEGKLYSGDDIESTSGEFENNHESSTERVMIGDSVDEFPSSTDELTVKSKEKLTDEFDGLDPSWEKMETDFEPLSKELIINDNQEITINNESSTKESTVKSTEESTEESSVSDLGSTSSKIENNNESSTKTVMIGSVDESASSTVESTEELTNELYPELLNPWGEIEPNFEPLSTKAMDNKDMIRPITKDYKSLLEKIEDTDYESITNNEGSNDDDFQSSTMSYSNDNNYETSSKIENDNESSTKTVMIGSVDESPSSTLATIEELTDGMDSWDQIYAHPWGEWYEMNNTPLSRKAMDNNDYKDIRPITEDYKSLLEKIENTDYESITNKEGNNDDDFESSTMSYSNDNHETSTNVVVTDNYETSTNVVNHDYDYEKRHFIDYSYHETSTSSGVNHDLESSTIMDDNESTSSESSDDDESSLRVTDMGSRITDIIDHFSSAIREVVIYYVIVVGAMFGIAATFHAILLFGVHYDYTTPILIWLIEQGVLLLLDLSFLITMVFYSVNSYAIFGQSLKFSFSLYCLLIVKSHHSNLKLNGEKLKYIDAV